MTRTRRSSTLVVMVIALMILAAPNLAVELRAFSGGGGATPSEAPGEIFGLRPWESRDSVFAKCLAAGIERIEIGEDYATFRDLVNRGVPSPQPSEVRYQFVKGYLSRITVTHTGSSQAYKFYGSYLYNRFGEPASHQPGGVVETTWEEDMFYFILRSNHKEQLERQLAAGRRDPDRIRMTMDVIFFPHPAKK